MKESIVTELLPRRSYKGIMRVDDPRQTIETLCSMGAGPVDYASFKKVYEVRENDAKPISRSHAEAHFFSLTVFGIIEETLTPKKYRMSESGLSICKALQSGDSVTYQRTLAEVLLTSKEKGEFLAGFLSYLQKARTTSEMIEKYARAGTTLLAWCKEAGLVNQDKGRGLYWTASDPVKSIEEFWDRLKSVYSRESTTKMPGVRSMFVRADQLRRSMLPYLKSEDEFEEYLGNLMHDPRYREKVELAGAPIVYVEREHLEPIKYNNRRYYFLSISAR